MKVTLCTALFLIASLNSSFSQQKSANSGKPIVLIEGRGGASVSALAIGPFATASNSKHDQTIELAKQLLKHCPEITLRVARSPEDAADYELFLNRDGENQIMLVRGSDQDVIFADDQARIKDAAKSGCRAILEDWNHSFAASKKYDHADGSQAERWYNVSKPTTPSTAAPQK